MKSTARFCFLVFGVACFAQEPPARAPVRVSGAVMAGNLLHKVTPTFPEEATRQGVNGIVVLHAVIGTDGRVKDLYAVSGPEPLRATYLAAVRQWIYKPYLLHDEVVPVETMISVDMQVGASSRKLE